VIGAEVHSTGLDISTAGREVTVLFDDGAVAVVIGRATDEAHLIRGRDTQPPPNPT